MNDPNIMLTPSGQVHNDLCKLLLVKEATPPVVHTTPTVF